MRKTGGREKTGGKHRDANVLVSFQSARVFVYSKIVHINPLLKAMFQAERFDSESDVSTLYDIV